MEQHYETGTSQQSVPFSTSHLQYTAYPMLCSSENIAFLGEIRDGIIKIDVQQIYTGGRILK